MYRLKIAIEMLCQTEQSVSVCVAIIGKGMASSKQRVTELTTATQHVRSSSHLVCVLSAFWDATARRVADVALVQIL